MDKNEQGEQFELLPKAKKTNKKHKDRQTTPNGNFRRRNYTFFYLRLGIVATFATNGNGSSFLLHLLFVFFVDNFEHLLNFRAHRIG